MAKALAAQYPDTTLPSSSGGDALKAGYHPFCARWKPSELLWKYYASPSVHALSSCSTTPTNNRRRPVDSLGSVRGGVKSSGNLSVHECSSRQPERALLVECVSPGKITGRLLLLTGVPVTTLKRTRKFLLLVAATALAIVALTTAVRSSQLFLFRREGELFNFSQQPLGVAAAAVIARSISIRSSLGLVLPLVALVLHARATAAVAEDSARTPVLQHEYVYVSDKHALPAAVEERSLFSGPPLGESKRGDHSSQDSSEGKLGEGRTSEGETRESKTIQSGRTSTAKSVGEPRESSEDQPAATYATSHHQADGATSEASAAPGASHEYHSRVQRLLLTLDNCYSDDDCFGSGRRCIEGRCWGFAGPVLRPFICRPGAVCTLEKLKGHFYRENRGKRQGHFMLKVCRGNDFDTCGRTAGQGGVLTTLNAGLRPDVLSSLPAGETISVSSVSVDERRTTKASAGEPRFMLSTGESESAAVAGAAAGYKELSEDQFLTDVRDDTCLTLQDTSDCPFALGSKPFSVKPGRVRRDSWTEHGPVPVAAEDVPLSENQVFPFAEESAVEGLTRDGLLRVNRLYYCSFPSTRGPQAVCEANLGVVPADMPVGMYIVCGCSGTDLNNTGTRCATEEDFAVPVARLLVAGFSQEVFDNSRGTPDSTNGTSTNSRRSNTENTSYRGDLRPPINVHGEKAIKDQVSSKMGRQTQEDTEFAFVSEYREEASQETSRETRRPTTSAAGRPKKLSPSAASRSHTDPVDAGLGSGRSLPSVDFTPKPRSMHHCSVGQVCYIMGIRGVALNSGDFFVDFLHGQGETCSGEQMSGKAKHILRLPCQPYAAGSLCMVSLSSANLLDLLRHDTSEGNEPQTVDVSSVEDVEALSNYDDPETSSATVDPPAGGRLEPDASFTLSASIPVSSSFPSASLETSPRHAYNRRGLSEISSKFGPYTASSQSWSDPSGHSSPRETGNEGGSRRRSAGAAPTLMHARAADRLLDDFDRNAYGSTTRPAGLISSAASHINPLVTTGGARPTVTEGSVATLCGCSSSETEGTGHHCRVPIFLGHFVVHGRISELGDFAKTPVVRHDKAAFNSVVGRAPREKVPEVKEDDTEPVQKKGADEDEESQHEVNADGAEEIVVRSSSAPLNGALVTGKRSLPEALLLSSSIAPARSMQSRSSPWRLLQYITGPAVNNPSDPGPTGSYSLTANECRVNTDCLSGTGVCDRGKCIGFIPDKDDSRLFRCVEGYWCDIKEGQIEGINISSKFEVIATSPSEPCGTARNLRPNESLFANANKWICDASSSTSCIFRAGVGHRRNKSHTVEGVRLCGCPHVDVNGDGIPCNHVRDFFVPLGIIVKSRLGVQECLTNAHCIDNAFAYCIEDHCGGFLVSAAAAGVNAFTCIRNQQCTLQSIAAKSVDQALKVIPVAANFSCGAEAALDPEYVKTSALPCIADVNNDGVCDINLGVNRALGTTRLCGCSGQDLGGNGRACDEAKDFDRDLGLVSDVQCIITEDCPPNSICAKGTCSCCYTSNDRIDEVEFLSQIASVYDFTIVEKAMICLSHRTVPEGECVEDDLEPYIVSMLPQNNTFAVPPLSHIDLIFNENIKFGRPGAAILIANLQQPSHKYLISLPPNAPSLKRIAAPVLVPGGVLPRLGGGGAGGGGGVGAAAGGGAGAAEGKGTGTTGLFGQGGQSHSGIIANKLADRDGFSMQQNGQRRSSRKLAALNGEERTGRAAEADVKNENKEESEKIYVAASAAQPKSRLKYTQQQNQDEADENTLSTLRKPGLGLQRDVTGNSNNTLLHGGGVKGWRRGGTSATTGRSGGSGISTVSTNPSNNRWLIELLGQRLRITPDKDATSLPLGEYRIGIEYGFVSDLVGNYNGGENNLRFTLAKDAGCPYLYVTAQRGLEDSATDLPHGMGTFECVAGFTTENGNCNGLYLPTDPMNEQASWQGGERNAFFIYWKREPKEGGRPAAQDGNWIIDTNLEDSSFLAFADLHAHASKKQGRSRALPPSGLWHKWTGTARTPQEHVRFHCTQQPDRFAASLIAIDPPVGAALHLSATTLLPLHPITLIFNKPMNYGHWAAIQLTPRGSSNSSSKRQHGSNSDGKDQNTSNRSRNGVTWYSDVEAGMRGGAIRVYNKPASEVLPSFPFPPPPPANSPEAFDFLVQHKEEALVSSSSAPSPFSSSSADKKALREKRSTLTRALQTRLFDQWQRAHRPLRAAGGATDASNEHLALVTGTLNAEPESSADGAPSRATAQEDSNDVVGVVELHVQQPLSPGETYDFTVQLGALTDLSYNPWGPVESGTIAFHTTGGRCRTALREENVVIRRDSSGESTSRSRGTARGSNEQTIGDGRQQQHQALNYAEAYVVLDLAGNPVKFNEDGTRLRATDSRRERISEDFAEGSSTALMSDLGAFANGEAQDGTKIRVRCRAGYSVHASARGLLMAEETILHCSDGRWHGEQPLPKCFRNCGVYPVLGGAYQMAGDVGGDGVEGEVIDVQCTNTAELLSVTGRQAIRCSGGKWDALQVKCGATCPPLGPALGSKYEVKQLEQRLDNSSSGSSRPRPRSSYGDDVSGGNGRQGGSDETGGPATTLLVPETGVAKEGAVRRVSCAPGSHSASESVRHSAGREGFGSEKAGEGPENEEAAENIRCGKDGWEQLHLQCFADCPVEQLAALLGQHGPGLEAAAGNFRDGRHGDRRYVSCAVGFAPAATNVSRLHTTCKDGSWLPLATFPASESAAASTTSQSTSEEESIAALSSTGTPDHRAAKGVSGPVCVPQCAALQLPEAAYVVTSLPDVRGADGSTQQQVRVSCAAAAVALGGPGAATEQLLTCSRAGVWGLLTLQCKAPCRAPLLQLGDRYEVRDGSGSTAGDRVLGAATQRAHNNAKTPNEAAQEEELYAHGTERLVGCAPGADVDGGGFSAAPQKIVCDDGLWQSAYRAVRSTGRNARSESGSSSNTRQALRAGAASIDLKCRRGCGAPPLPQGVQPLLLSSRAVLLQRWQHDTYLVVGCARGFSAFLPEARSSATTLNGDMAEQPRPEASRQGETLVCRDGVWESPTHPRHVHQTQQNTPSLPAVGGGRRGRTARQSPDAASSQYRQLQHHQNVAAGTQTVESAAGSVTEPKTGSLYLTLECRRDCAAADIRRLAQQQHFEFQQLEPYDKTVAATIVSKGSSIAAEGLSFGSTSAFAAALRHGQSRRVACQRNFEILSGASPQGASAISCSHGRLLLPPVVCGRPSCSDGIQNGDETGVDCGGSICSSCASCSDGLQNNDETGVDCGGSCPPCHSCPFPPLGVAAAPPPVGMHHVIAVRIPRPTNTSRSSSRSESSGSGESDSIDSYDRGNHSDRRGETSTNSNREGASLFDYYRSFEETGRYVRTHFTQGSADRPLLPPGSSLHLQCGTEVTASGPAASRRFAVLRCMPSGQWLWAAEAAAAAAFSRGAAAAGTAEQPLHPQLICTPPTCFDGVRNGDETGVDCGGSCSRSCASCFNGIQDGEEEDVDCGGRDCEPCSSCSPRLLKPFLLNNSSAFAIVRRGAVVSTSVAAAAGISSSSIPSALVLDEELAKGTLHPLLTGHGQQLQIKCRTAEAPFPSYLPARGTPTSNEEASSSLAAASAGAYYTTQQQQPQGVKQPLPLTVHCRHGVWTTPAVAAASALALTKSASAQGQPTPQSPSSFSPSSGSSAVQLQQQGSWLARAALEAHQALENFRETCLAYRRATTENNILPRNHLTEVEEADVPGSAAGINGSTAAYGSTFVSSVLPNALPATARRQLYWSQPHFAVFAVPDFRVKPGTAIGAGENPDRGIPAGEADGVSGDACVSRLIETFRTSLQGECGALAFGSSSLKISSFCSNSCRRGLEEAIWAATAKTSVPGSPLSSSISGSSSGALNGCSSPQAAARVRKIAQLLRELLEVWCKQKSGNYCFAEAEASFAFVQQVYFLVQSGTYYESELAAACPADSCFRNNIRHIVLLTQLSKLVDVPQPAPGTSSTHAAAANILSPTTSARRPPHAGRSQPRRLRQQEWQPTYGTSSRGEKQARGPRSHQLFHQQRHPERRYTQEQMSQRREDREEFHSHRLAGGTRKDHGSHGSTPAAQEEATGDDTSKIINDPSHEPCAHELSPPDVKAEGEDDEVPRGDTPAAVDMSKEEPAWGAVTEAAATPPEAPTATAVPRLAKGERRLLAISATTAQASEMGWDESGTRRFLSDIANLPQIMDLLCMRVEGQSCAPEVLRVGVENPVLHSPAADAEETQRICVRNPCVLEVVRTFGQLLMDSADVSLSALQHQQQRIASSNWVRSSKSAADRRKSSTEHLLQPRQFSSSLFGHDEGERDIPAKSLGRKVASTPASAAGPEEEQWDTPNGPHQATLLRGVFASSVHPRDVVLGMLMKYWGRTFCHRNVHGALCGGFVFPSKENAALLQESRAAFPPWSPQRERKLYHCKCPTAFVGDGDCDVSCFSPECEWDGGDCLATELVFPVYRHIISQLGRELSESCNPFNAAFTCSTGSLNSSEANTTQQAATLQHSSANINCASYFNKLAETRGCCLATQLEVLRDLLEADVRILESTRRNSTAGSEDRSSRTAGVSASSSSSTFHVDRQYTQAADRAQSLRTQLTWPLPPRRWQWDVWLQLDRSSFFFEYACQQQLDRTCSRGLSRFAYAVEFKIGNVDYDELLQSCESGVTFYTASGEPTLTLAAHRGLGHATIGLKNTFAVNPVFLQTTISGRRNLSQGSSTSTSSGSHRQEARRGAGGASAGNGEKALRTDDAGSHSSSGSRKGVAAEAADENLREKGVLEKEESAREFLLRAEASPKLHEFKRVLREELAAIFNVPAADVIEMRVWRGSVDVHAVIDAGWLSNRRSFKERVESLTADPNSSNSLSARLSAGLTRHLAARPSYWPLVHQWSSDATVTHLQLLVLGLPTFPHRSNEREGLRTSSLLTPGDGEGGDISVTSDHVFVQRVPLVQQLRYHPGSATATVLMPAPPFGTFGVSEVQTESRECIGAEGLHPGEGGSISEAYRFSYKNVPSADGGPAEASQHGDTMVVACNVGHEAVAGESPQKLICNQGRWEPLSSLLYAYSRLQPTSPAAARLEQKERVGVPASASLSSPVGRTNYVSATDNNSKIKPQLLPAGHHAEFYPAKKSPPVIPAASPGTPTALATPATSSSAAISSSALTQTLPQHAAAAAPRILLCRRPCLPYERVDPAILRAEFVVSGMGSSHGDKRTVFCAPGYSPRDADTFPSAQQMLTCVNGVWLPPRALVCEKDFAAVSGSSTSSPCSGALSGLEERYRLTEVSLSATINPDISADLANAINARLQPKGVSLQVFKITCARGYTHQHSVNTAVAPSSVWVVQQQPEQQHTHQNGKGGNGRNSGEVFVACLNGVLIGFGTEELFPHGGSAEGHRAVKLAAAFEMRLRQHSDNTIALAQRRRVAAPVGVWSAPAASSGASVGGTAHGRSAETSLVAEMGGIPGKGKRGATTGRTAAADGKAWQLQADLPQEAYLAVEDDNRQRRLSTEMHQKVEDEDDSDREADYVQRNLTCERDVRMDPPIEAKPISDTVMVFLCLLVLFALTVFFLTGWWVWNTKKRRRGAPPAVEAPASPGGDLSAAAEEKGVAGPVVQSEGHEWYPENGRQYSEYYVQTTAPGLSQNDGNSCCSNGSVMQKPTAAQGVPAEITAENFADVSGSDSHCLLLSRYYWLAAAAAAAGTATVKAAEGRVDACDGDRLAVTHIKTGRTSNSKCPAIDAHSESTERLAVALLPSQGSKLRDQPEADTQIFNLKHQEGGSTFPNVSSPKCDSLAVVAALTDIVDTNREAKSPQQSATLQLLFPNVNVRRLWQQEEVVLQQQEAVLQQDKAHVTRENHGDQASEGVGSGAEGHGGLSVEPVHSENENVLCFTEEPEDGLSKIRRDNSKDSLSPIYLRGLPGDHVSFSEVREPSILDGNGDRESAWPMADARWPPQTDNVQDIQPTEADTSASPGSLQQPHRVVLIPPSYQKQQMQLAAESGRLQSYVHPASVLTKEAFESADRSGGLLGQLHHDGRSQLPGVETQDHREEPRVLGRVLQERRDLGVRADTTGSSPPHMSKSRDDETVEPTKHMLKVQGMYCNRQNYGLYATSGEARARQRAPHDVPPSTSIANAYRKDQLTADCGECCIEERHSVSTVASLDRVRPHISRRHSTGSNSSTRSTKGGALRTIYGLPAEAGELRDENALTGGKAEIARAVTAKTAKRGSRSNGGSTTHLLGVTEDIEHLRSTAAITRHIRPLQQQGKVPPTGHASEVVAVTPASEDELYPEDSASCVGQKGYCGRMARSAESPSGCDDLTPVTGTDSVGHQQLRCQPATHEMCPFSGAPQQRNQRVMKQAKLPQRLQRMQQQSGG